MGVQKVSAFHPFIFQKSGKSTIIRNLAVPHHFVAYLVFISSIRVDPGPTNRGPTLLLALKMRIYIRTPVANTGKLRSIGQVPVKKCAGFMICYQIETTKIILKGTGRRGRDRMVVGFTAIRGISAYHH